MLNPVVKKLLESFPGSFIDNHGEFIANRKGFSFRLEDCKSEMDVKCKVLEWLSRAAYKSQPYKSHKKNEELHSFMRHGINDFLDADFTHEDMEQIYTRLGNCINHTLTIEFIESDYDMEVLSYDK